MYTLFEKALDKFPCYNIDINGKDHSLYIFSQDEEINVFDGILFLETNNETDINYLIKRYRPLSTGYRSKVDLCYIQRKNYGLKIIELRKF